MADNQEKLTDAERLDEGQILVRTIIEMLGKPKEFIEKALKSFIERLKKDERFEVIKETYEKPEQHESMFSLFVEVELWCKETINLTDLCYDYMPSSIEILEPDRFVLNANEFSDYLNDMQARLHDVDMKLKNMTQENQNLRNNASQLLKNVVYLALEAKPLSLKELSLKVGIPTEALPKLLEPLIKKKFITKEGDTYKNGKSEKRG